nr:cis-aconitate decarboxylase [synthetic construct]
MGTKQSADSNAKSGVTAEICHWASNLATDDIPSDVLERAKYLILDGIACAWVGARVPWSEKYVQATMSFEPPGACRVIGYGQKLGPVAAAMTNSAFIQATELDDYHSEAPLHSASIVLPAVFAASEVLAEQGKTISGIDVILAAIVGFESGPRIGKAIYGSDLLNNGWHCGAVYGAPAGALATGKLLGLTPDSMEDALGIACTQACGLMSAQYGGMVKRVQHGFAARNGLLGGLLAYGGYEAMKGVLERSYGGFLKMFTKGNGREPPYKEEEVVAGLGSFWHTFTIRIKLYACCGLVHGPVEAIEKLQRRYPELLNRANLSNIRHVYVQLSTASNSHCGWIPEERPISSIAGQMSVAYILAVQLVDQQCLLAQFSEFDDNLERPEVWDLARKVTPSHSEEFDQDGNCLSAGRVRIEFNDGSSVTETVEKPLGVKEPMPNERILHKYRTLAGSVTDESRVKEIEDLVLSLDRLTDITPLLELLNCPVKSPLV